MSRNAIVTAALMGLATLLPALAADDAKKVSDVYKVKFETSKGDVIVEVHRDWSPIGADRFKELVEAKFFDECRFFRVVPNFVVQFGINGDPQTNVTWRAKQIADDPVKESNKRGYLTFATSGANSRTTQLFINLRDNAGLDRQGFSPFGKVIEGMNIVDELFSGYGETPNQQRIQAEGNAYLTQTFAKLDYIKTARIVP
ncbi:MAG: peptidylprolyl isomerase [Acidobacteriota bacterium]